MKQIQSDFAILDVKHGRVALKKAVEHGEPLEVIIHGRISDIWGKDDGESREFSVEVNSVEIK